MGNQITQFVRSINPASKDDHVILQPFRELHLAPSFDYPFQTYGSLLLVTVFSVIALLILLIAWVNYINLSTAQSLHLAREAGVRKVLGARRFQLITQYLTETFIITVLAVIVALLLVNIFQPLFNEFTGKQFSLVRKRLDRRAGNDNCIYCIVNGEFMMKYSIVSANTLE